VKMGLRCACFLVPPSSALGAFAVKGIRIAILVGWDAEVVLLFATCRVAASASAPPATARAQLVLILFVSPPPSHSTSHVADWPSADRNSSMEGGNCGGKLRSYKDGSVVAIGVGGLEMDGERVISSLNAIEFSPRSITNVELHLRYPSQDSEMINRGVYSRAERRGIGHRGEGAPGVVDSLLTLVPQDCSVGGSETTPKDVIGSRLTYWVLESPNAT
jgi:hypothetical protein